MSATMEAETRVQMALEHLQEARRHVELAGQAICSVRPLGKEWNALGTLDEKIRSMWYRVNRRRDSAKRQGTLQLDGIASAPQGVRS